MLNERETTVLARNIDKFLKVGLSENTAAKVALLAAGVEVEMESEEEYESEDEGKLGKCENCKHMCDACKAYGKPIDEQKIKAAQELLKIAEMRGMIESEDESEGETED